MKQRVLAIVLLASLVGCPADEDKASTWTKRLDTKEYDTALKRIDEIGDPSAIEDVGKTWQKTNKPEILAVLIALAEPLTPEEAKTKFKTDYEETGRPANWKAAMPFLTQAVTKTDESDGKKVEAAAKCAGAIGISKDPEGLDALIEVGKREPSTGLARLQKEAIKAIGKFDNEPAKASAALIEIINSPKAPPHPKTIEKSKRTPAVNAKYDLYLQITAHAVDALGELHVSSAAKPLLMALYRTPELFNSIRRALVATGPTAKAELRAVIQGKNAEVEKYFAYTAGTPKKASKAFYCGDRSERGDEDCIAVSAKDHYAAIILADFHDEATVPDLLAILDRPPAPAYFDEQHDERDNPGPIQYEAVFAALKKIGSVQAADRVRSLWIGKKEEKKPATPPGAAEKPANPFEMHTRTLAASAYAFVARDDQGLKELGEIAGKNGLDEGLRAAAAESLARLSKSSKDMAFLDGIATELFAESAKLRKEADGDPKKKADEADAQLKEDKKPLEAAKKRVQEARSPSEKDRARGDVKRAEAEYKKAQKRNETATAPFKNLDKRSRMFRNAARLFLSHKSRIEVAQRCSAKPDPAACYVSVLEQKPEDAVKNLRPFIKELDESEAAVDAEMKKLSAANVSDEQRKEIQAKLDVLKKAQWSKQEKLMLLQGNVERAMLEVGKMGKAAEKYTDKLLDAAKSDDRSIRQIVLLTLPKIAKVPCDSCVKKLDAAVKADKGKNAVAALQLDTVMLRNYFIYAGNRTPKPEDR